MTESEVRKLLRRMKELDSQTAFRAFYDMTYDRLYRIAYYYVKQMCIRDRKYAVSRPYQSFFNKGNAIINLVPTFSSLSARMVPL